MTGIEQLVAISAPRSAGAEAYRTLQTNLRFSNLDKSARTILFTSADEGEGQSIALANLGITTAQAGSRVILVDCNLRRPALQDIFNLPNTAGFTTMLLNDAGATLPAQATSITGLRVVTSGPLPPSPAEVLASERVRGVLDALLGDADLLLVDSPPANTFADASILAGRVDGVVLVVNGKRTRREQAVRAKEQLDRVGARIIGVVLNNAGGRTR